MKPSTNHDSFKERDNALLQEIETIKVGNHLLDRAKEVAQKIVERVRALFAEAEKRAANGD